MSGREKNGFAHIILEMLTKKLKAININNERFWWRKKIVWGDRWKKLLNLDKYYRVIAMEGDLATLKIAKMKE